MVAGLLATFDQFHLASGLMNHQDNWVDKLFPWWLSPNYMVGGCLFYLLFEKFFATSRSTSLFCLDFIQSLVVVCQHCLVYAISFFLCNYKIVYYDHNEVAYPNLPFVLFHLYSASLMYSTLKSKTAYWMMKEKIILYCLSCAALGLSFEWLSSMLPFGFKHQPCFDDPAHWTCGYTPVAFTWLVWVYVHQALIVFQMSLV